MKFKTRFRLNRIHWWLFNQFFDIMYEPKKILYPDGSEGDNPFGGKSWGR